MAGVRFIEDCRSPKFRDIVNRKQRLELPLPPVRPDEPPRFEEACKNALIFAGGMLLMFLLVGVWR